MVTTDMLFALNFLHNFDVYMIEIYCTDQLYIIYTFKTIPSFDSDKESIKFCDQSDLLI